MVAPVSARTFPHVNCFPLPRPLPAAVTHGSTAWGLLLTNPTWDSQKLRVPASFPGVMASYVYNWEEDFVRKAVYQGLLSMEPFLPRAQSPESGTSRLGVLQPLVCKPSDARTELATVHTHT